MIFNWSSLKENHYLHYLTVSSKIKNLDFFKIHFSSMKRDLIEFRSYMCVTKKIGSLTLFINSGVYCSHFQKDYMLILMVRHYSKLQYPYQISLSKCKMKRVLRRFLNSLRIEQFDVVVDLTSSPVPTRASRWILDPDFISLF